VELPLVGTVWRIVLAFLLCSSSAQISSSSKLCSSRRRESFATLTRSRHFMYRPSRFSRSVFKLLELIAAGGVPKNGRNNPRIFNRLENLGGCASCFSAGKRFRLEHLIAGREPGRCTLQGFFSYRLPSLPVTPRLSRCASGFFFPGVRAVALQVTVQAGSPDP
jgi:hypothetical protein